MDAPLSHLPGVQPTVDLPGRHLPPMHRPSRDGGGRVMAMKREYRFECDECGRDEVKSSKPKRTPWHYPGRLLWATNTKRCYAAPRISSRQVTPWEAG